MAAISDVRTAAPATLSIPSHPAWALEAGLVVALGALALALRVPNHQIIPAFTDETEEIYRALQVARGELLPLTNATAIIGSFWNYVLPVAFWVSG